MTGFYFESIESRNEADIINLQLDNIQWDLREMMYEKTLGRGTYQSKIVELEDLRMYPKQLEVEAVSGDPSLFKVGTSEITLDEIKSQYERTKHKWKIYNRNYKEITWEELEQGLVNWRSNRPVATEQLHEEDGFLHKLIEKFFKRKTK